jgi:hypothetical protein
MSNSKNRKPFEILFIGCSLLIGCNHQKIIEDYSGTPFSDTRYSSGAQQIPGKVQLEYFDIGGEGVAYHDSDSTNSGSGRLNPSDGSYLNEFRINEPVDISYTKSRDIDDHNFNLVNPEMDQLYVGWTEPGEWTSYTVDVKTEGNYQLGLMYTANRNGQISLAMGDKDLTGPLNVLSTYDAADSVNWRQWHHWNFIDSLTTIQLDKGIQKLTLHTVAEGNMNFDYLNFILIGDKK